MMRLSRLSTSHIVSRRKALVAALLVAIAGGGGLAARAWQDAPSNTRSWAEPNAAPKSQFETRQIQGQSAIPGLATVPASGQRFPAQARASTSFFNAQQNTSTAAAATWLAPAESRELAELSFRIGQLLGKLRSSPENKSELQQELKTLLAQQFDLKHASQTERLDQLKASLVEAEEALVDRKDNREQIIDRRANELLGESDRYAWEYQQQIDPSGRLLSTAPATSTIYGYRLPQYVPGPGVAVPSAPSAQLPPTRSPVPPSATQPWSIPLGPSGPSSTTQTPRPPRSSNSQVPDSSATLLKAQLDTARRELEGMKRLYEMAAISSSELAKAESQLRIAEAQLESTVENLKLQIESARIDLDAEQADLTLLRQESSNIKSDTSEGYQLQREVSRAQANLQKAELLLAQKVRQLERLMEVSKALPSDNSAGETQDDARTP